MIVARIALTLLALLFASLIIWAIWTGDFWTEGAWLIRNPWGLVSLSDLYLGFLVQAILIFVFEPPRNRWLWIIALPFLGNVVTLLWLALRLPALHDRLRHKTLV
jgi:hypothetical protein